MNATPEATATAHVQMKGDGWSLDADMTVPAGVTALRRLLPMVQGLADAVVQASVKTVEDAGLKISCQAGCGACCRQLVPVAAVEARRLREVIDDMPEPRRGQVRARFATTLQKLEKAGIGDRLRHWQQLTEETLILFAQDYFVQNVACPFLEDESCSIYADRPVACREYLVTSPAEECAQPTPTMIHKVLFPLRVGHALRLVRPAVGDPNPMRWMPLVLAPQWAENAAPEPEDRSGPELLRELFAHLRSDSGNDEASGGR